MKTVVCGLGKCGSRMMLDLNALLYNGEFSWKLRAESSRGLELWRKFMKLFASSNQSSAFIHDDEAPSIYLGDPDGENEVVALLSRDSGNTQEELIRDKLKHNLIHFDNYRQACGQYHIVGEKVMANLMTYSPGNVDKKVMEPHIKKNSADNASIYFLCFSAGGGTGCGTSTVLAEELAKKIQREDVVAFIAGIAILPGSLESENYSVSAGRFITKVLSSAHAKSFDAVFTVSNSILANLRTDMHLVQSQANVFAANIICSIINSSSRYSISPINPDGTELRKNIHGLAYFCHAQASGAALGELPALDLLRRALQPVENQEDTERSDKETIFQGTSINLYHPRFFPREELEKILCKISEYRTQVENGLKTDKPEENSVPLGDQEKLNALLEELFPDQKKGLPLATRSCDNVVVLRGIPADGGKSTPWEQTALTKILERLFPKASIHYYATYHKMREETLTLLPSGYISQEILGFITEYLASVWQNAEGKKPEKKEISALLSGQGQIGAEELEKILGPREHFELKYKDFLDMQSRITSICKLQAKDWENSYLDVEDAANMINRVRDVVSFVKRAIPEDDDAWQDDFDL